jgi:hypothetical protein
MAIHTWVLTLLSEVPKKAFEAQVLFDPFEEQFDLPAVAIECGHG